jgi:hypothetical protein
VLGFVPLGMRHSAWQDEIYISVTRAGNDGAELGNVGPAVSDRQRQKNRNILMCATFCATIFRAGLQSLGYSVLSTEGS